MAVMMGAIIAADVTAAVVSATSRRRKQTSPLPRKGLSFESCCMLLEDNNDAHKHQQLLGAYRRDLTGTKEADRLRPMLLLLTSRVRHHMSNISIVGLSWVLLHTEEMK